MIDNKKLNGPGLTKENMGEQAKAVVEALENLLGNVYADFDVSRDKVHQVAERGRALTKNPEVWPVDARESAELLKILDSLERKINQTLDLKKLKEEGLVKAVKL